MAKKCVNPVESRQRPLKSGFPRIRLAMADDRLSRELIYRAAQRGKGEDRQDAKQLDLSFVQIRSYRQPGTCNVCDDLGLSAGAARKDDHSVRRINLRQSRTSRSASS